MKGYRSSIIVILVAVILAGCQGQNVPTAAPVQTDVGEQNMAIVRQVYDSIAAGDVETFASLHANPFTLNYPGGSEEVDPQLMGDDLAAIRNANPDLHAEIQDMYASGDLVVTQLTWRATHTGDFFGIPATGNPVVHNGVVVRRLQDGKVVESWETFDDFEFLRNLGFVPSWDEVIANASAPEPPQQTESIVSSPEAMIGIWRGRPGSPGDPPQTYWWFKADGTYRVVFEVEQFSDNYSVESGTYTFSDTSLVLKALSGGCADDPAVDTGTYDVKLISNADGTPARLVFTMQEDNCNPRQNAIRGPAAFVQAQP